MASTRTFVDLGTQENLLDGSDAPLGQAGVVKVTTAGRVTTLGGDEGGASPVTRRARRASSSLSETTFGQYWVDRGEDTGDKNRAIRDFYTSQDRVVDSFAEADTLITRHNSGLTGVTDNDEADAHRLDRRVNFATNLSLFANICLLIVKTAVLVSTGSLAVLSSWVDSALDLFSATVIYLTNKYMAKHNRYLYPMGKQRFEPLATIIIASVMATAAIELVSRAIQAIVADEVEVKLSAVDLGLLGSTVVIKVGLHLLCRVLPGASMEALATDHRNDSVSNSVAMLTTWIGATYWANADPVGAIIIGLFIITSWYYQGREHVLNLAGRGASPQFIQQLTWVAMHHDDRVELVDTVRAIHFGCGFLVEVDIVLKPEMPLHEAHDIGESLQHKLELLPMCDRAHVHLDYECDHGPEDEHKRL